MNLPPDGPPARARRARAPRTALALAAAVLAGCTEPGAPALPAGTPIIVVTIDTLTARHLSLHGYELPTSPHLDAFAGRATVFEANTTQCNSTFPSLTSILTGLYVRTHKNLLAVPADGTVAASGGERSLAEHLGAAGYHTIGVVSHPSLTAEPSGDAFKRGWDAFSVIPPGVSEPRALWANAGYTNERALALLADWNEERDGPLFLWLHYFDPHTDLSPLVYCPPVEFRDRFLDAHLAAVGRESSRDELVRRSPTERSEWIATLPLEERRDLSHANGNALYDAEVAYTDHGLRRLFDRLDERGVLERALIVVLADHGENLSGRRMGTDNVDFTHRRLFEDVAHTPLIIKLPGQRAGQRSDALTQNVDVLPTVLELCGLAIEPAVDGRSLVPLLRDPGASVHTETYVESSDNVEKAVRSRDLKLIDADGERPVLLYDWRRDPDELRNLADAPEVEVERTRLATLIERFRPEEVLAVHLAPGEEAYAVELDVELPRSGVEHAYDGAGRDAGTIADDGRRFRWSGTIAGEPVDLRLFLKNRKPPLTWTLRRDGRAPAAGDVAMGQVPLDATVAIPLVNADAPAVAEPPWSLWTDPAEGRLELRVAASPRPRVVELSYDRPDYSKAFEVLEARGLASVREQRGTRLVLEATAGEELTATIAHAAEDPDDLLCLFRDDGRWPARAEVSIDGRTRSDRELRFRWPFPGDKRLNALLLATPDLATRPPGSITIWRTGGGQVAFDRARMDPRRAAELEALGYLDSDE